LIYDCFIYNGEESLLELRVNELSLCKDNVFHVLIEATQTFTGQYKPIYYTEMSEKYKNICLMVVGMPKTNNAWEREAYQRNAIKTALLTISPNDEDVVIISDIDEVPRAKQVNLFSPEIEFAALILDKYAYFLNCIESEQSWNRSRIMTWKYLKDRTPEGVRNSGYDFSIHHAGWHWSWLFDPVAKLKAFSHTELNTPENIERVKRRENIWNEDKFKVIDINLSHPEYLYKNQEKFQHLICQQL